MGVVTGPIEVATSTEELAYSEDPDVVAGKRAGCGWCPVEEFDRVGPGADVVSVRTLNGDGERNRFRNLYAAGKPADANQYAVQTALEHVRVQVDGKTAKLKAAKAVAWVKAVARTNPAALDLLADRINLRTAGRKPEDGYADARRALGYGPLVEEVDADGGCKSDEAGGA